MRGRAGGCVARKAFGIMSCGFLTESTSGFGLGTSRGHLTNIPVQPCLYLLEFANPLAAQFLPKAFCGACLDTAHTPFSSPSHASRLHSHFTLQMRQDFCQFLLLIVFTGSHVTMLLLFLFGLPYLLQAVLHTYVFMVIFCYDVFV